MKLLTRSTEEVKEQQPDEAGRKSRTTKVVQGGVVFVVMFVVLWTLLSRMTNAEESPDST